MKKQIFGILLFLTLLFPLVSSATDISDTRINTTEDIFSQEINITSFAYNQTLPAINQILDYAYYNSTNFDYNDYYLKSNPYGYYNSTTLTGVVSGAGTYGYIPMWNGTNSINNSVVYQNGTNIGIGTTSPQNPLNVIGRGNFTGDLFSQGINLTALNSTGLIINWSNSIVSGEPLWNGNYSNVAFLSINNTFSANQVFNGNTNFKGMNIFNIIGHNDSVQINVNGTQHAFAIARLDSGNVHMTFNNPATTFVNSQGLDIGLEHTGNAFIKQQSPFPLEFYTNNTHRLIIDENGLVGINTATPKNTLNVVGDANFTGNTTSQTDFCIEGGNCLSTVSGSGAEPLWNGNYSSFLNIQSLATNGTFLESYTETDPLWTSNQSLYTLLSTLNNGSYLNPDLANYVQWNTIYNFVYNETEVNNLLNAKASYSFLDSSYYNQTQIQAINTSMKNYVDSTFQPIGSYLVSSDLNPYVQWTNLWAQVYNETEVNAINTSMKNYVDNNFLTSYTETDPTWNANIDQVAFKNESNTFTENQTMNGNLEIGEYVNYTVDGVTNYYSNGCYSIANSTGLFEIC